MASSTQKHYKRKALKGETRTIKPMESRVYKKQLDRDSYTAWGGRKDSRGEAQKRSVKQRLAVKVRNDGSPLYHQICQASTDQAATPKQEFCIIKHYYRTL